MWPLLLLIMMYGVYLWPKSWMFCQPFLRNIQNVSFSYKCYHLSTMMPTMLMTQMMQMTTTGWRLSAVLKLGYFANKGLGQQTQFPTQEISYNSQTTKKPQRSPIQVRGHKFDECKRMHYCCRVWHSWWQLWQYRFASLHRCQLQLSHQPDHLWGHRHYYNWSTQHKTETKITSLHQSIQKKNRTGPNCRDEMQNWYRCRCKCYANFCFQQCLIPLRKFWRGFDSEWNNLTAYGGATISQFGDRIIKGMWNNTKWKFIFHIKDTQGPVLLRLRTPETNRHLHQTPYSPQRLLTFAPHKQECPVN